MKKLNKPVLSIVIVSFNTRDVLKNCLLSLAKVREEIPFEVLVSDNGSTDGSVQLIKSKFKWVKLLENKNNLGFSKANNLARPHAHGKYVLFLNSDTIVHKNTLKTCVEYLDDNKDVMSVTCKILLPSGQLDKDTRRSFPTPFIALTHFTGLDRLFSKSRIFSKYWYGYLDEDTEHEVDVIQGAYHMSRKKVLDKVGWFDEDYFLDGEDIDICWKIKSLNKKYKIVYFPKVKITHIKKASKRRSKSTLRLISGIKAMEIFYKKRLWKHYPTIINYAVLAGIRTLLLLRLLKYHIINSLSLLK